MKAFSPAVILLLILSCVTVFAQQNNSSGFGSTSGKIIHGTEFKLKFYGVYSLGEYEDTHWKNGYGVSASMQFNVIEDVSFFVGLDIAKVKLIEKKEHVIPYVTVAEGMVPSYLFNLGLRAYPLDNKYPLFIKMGVGAGARKRSITMNEKFSMMYSLNLGIGYELWLGDRINVYPEIDYFKIVNISDMNYGVGMSVRL